jgi:GntR family transcriptional repressor for pyruvate dehydrogenase complex
LFVYRDIDNKYFEEDDMDLSSDKDIFAKPVARQQKLSVLVANRILSMINSGELKTGDQLPPERVLCDKFEVGRTSLREALAALEFVGMIDSRQGRGTIVQSIDVAADTTYQAMELLLKDESPKDILEARKAVEADTAALAAMRANDQDLVTMENTIKEMDIHLKREKVFSMESDRQFHLTIAKASHNTILYRLARMVLNFTRQTLWTTLRDHTHMNPKLPQKYMSQHHDLFSAIKDSKPEVARDVMVNHLEDVMYDIFVSESQ